MYMEGRYELCGGTSEHARFSNEMRYKNMHPILEYFCLVRHCENYGLKKMKMYRGPFRYKIPPYSASSLS